MKKLLTLVVGLLALTSISFAVSDNEIQAKKNQLLPLISLILNSNEYTEAQKNTVKAVISNCATSNKNEVIRGACGMITEEITTKEEIEIPPENNPKNRETINEKTILWCN
ncbi:MAG: hypothetical protein LBG59_00280 [Candidatus Peribacteria bacterium]|jgi:hypothetical protein|nr:hypothetical protein [Candidatus Peribacteria bacterium]